MRVEFNTEQKSSNFLLETTSLVSQQQMINLFWYANK